MQRWFDDLARAVAGGKSRRQALKQFGGVVGAAVVAAIPGQALADPGGNSDCAHFCNDVEPPGPGRGECKSDAAHGQGLCATCGPAAPTGHPDVCGAGTSAVACCPAATPNCCNNQTCVSLASDVHNCGACGKVCQAPPNGTATCVGGVCGFACNAGFTLCNGACVNEQTDVHNCGACGKVCPQGASCTGGACVCPQGTVACAGACFSNLCPDGQVFNPAACACRCPPGTTACGGACVNTATDVSNCGACGKVCPPGPANSTPTCTAGMCGFTCNAGFQPCNGACIAAAICCNGACPSGQICVNGGCFKSCTTVLCGSRTCSANCTCIVDENHSGPYCADAGFPIKFCSTDADCPSGTLCSNFGSGGSPPFLCTRPCPCPA